MNGWESFCNKICEAKTSVSNLKRLAEEVEYGVYPDSINITGGYCLFLAKHDLAKVLIVLGDDGKLYDSFDGIEKPIGKNKAKVCELSNANCSVIRSIFPFTNPSSHKGKAITVGLGDRLGLASPGHIRLVRDLDVFPVLAQQSVRELNLTGRTYDDVLAAAAWAVFQEGYTKGYGADGDHLKTAAEVKMALDCGFTMITLDCSDHIDNKAASLTGQAIADAYGSLPDEVKKHYESKYLDRTFTLSEGFLVKFSSMEFMRTVLIYHKAILHTLDIYNNVIKNCGRQIDFEMSIDETLTSTTPESHFFTASELIDAGVAVTSLASRFCGEFQKGIDYRGDVDLFTKEFSLHVKIAEYFGYKISVHSGSDKFTVFPIIGAKTGGRYHLKTAGTNWLEAVRIIASKNPALYRRMHGYALGRLEEAKKYYHISAQASSIPDIGELDDGQLPGLMDKDDSRQVLHITYGLLLFAMKPDGASMFKDEIYRTLNLYEADYYSALQRHIGRHLEKLGLI